MEISKNMLRKVIRRLIIESEEEKTQEKSSSKQTSSDEVDPRYSTDTLKIGIFPYDKQYDHEGKKFPAEISDWATWSQFPNNFLHSKFCWIPPENIPDNFNLPTVGLTPDQYVKSKGLFKMEMKKGKLGPRLTMTLQDMIKQLRNPRSWAYGTQTTPMLPHPETGKTMMPPAWSAYYRAAEKRSEIMAKKIKAGEQSMISYTKKHGYGSDGKALGAFRRDLNALIRDESKHVSREEGAASNKKSDPKNISE